MHRRFDLKDEQHKGHHDEGDAEPVNRHHAQPVQREAQARHADHACSPAARRADLDDERRHADAHEDENHVRVGDEHEQLFEPAHRDGESARAGGVEHPRPPVNLDLEAVKLREQAVHILGDEVHEPGVERLGRADRAGLRHRLTGDPHRVRAAPLGEAARLGAQVGLGLLAGGARQVLALRADRAAGPDGGLRSHRRGMPGEGDQQACRGSLRAARPDEHHDRHVAVADILDDLEGGIDVAAGGVEHNNHGLRVAGVGLVDAALDVPGEWRHDRAARIEHDDLDAALRAGGGDACQRRECDEG